jgi:hypothetical protein
MFGGRGSPTRGAWARVPTTPTSAGRLPCLAGDGCRTCAVRAVYYIQLTRDGFMHPGRDVSPGSFSLTGLRHKDTKASRTTSCGELLSPFFFYFVPPLLSLFESEISKRGHVTEFLTAEDTMMPCPYSRQ